ncbi:MAG: NAD-dependent epimerase/dehydratase family protein, partial [Miltoncostaeaceae bacterium]
MRVLITGVTGFAGRHLAAHCVERGAEVHGAVRQGRSGAVPDGVRPHEVSLADPQSVRELLDRVAPERVFHLAGSASVGQSFADALGTWEGNLGATLGVLEALRSSGGGARTLIVTSGE